MDGAALDQVENDLTEEQRVAVASNLHGLGELLWELVVRKHKIQVVCRLPSVEPPQWNLNEDSAFDQFMTDCDKGMCRQRHLRLPVRTHDEQPLQFRPAEEISQHLHGGRVRPVEIVDCDDERKYGRDVGDETGELPLHSFR